MTALESTPLQLFESALERVRLDPDVATQQPLDQARKAALLIVAESSAVNTAEMVFSFRAECISDVMIFLGRVRGAGHSIKSNLQPDLDGLPDVDVEIQTDATLAQLEGLLRSISDSHVILQTLRQIPLEVNPLTRDYHKK